MSISIQLFLFSIAIIIQGWYVLVKARKNEHYLLLIYNLLIIFSFAVKPYLSCAGYYVVYTGCEGSPSTLLFVWIPIFLFFAIQQLSCSSRRRVISECIEFRKNTAVNYILLLFMLLVAVYKWEGIGNFTDFTSSRLSSAAASGVLSFMLDSMIMLIIAAGTYKKAPVYSIVLSILAFMSSGQKIFLLLPFILYLISNYGGDLFKFRGVLAGGLTLFSLILLGQYVRDENAVLDFDGIFLLLSIPFDAFDNSVTIVEKLNAAHSWYDYIFPLDVSYLAETWLQAVPRVLWSGKPVDMGFWRIQSMYLPELYFGADGMSVSTSMQADMYFSVGLFFCCIFLFPFIKIIQYSNIHGNIYSRIFFVFLLSFSIEFTRGGFRTIANLIISIVISVILAFVFVSLSRVLRKRNAKYRNPCL